MTQCSPVIGPGSNSTLSNGDPSPAIVLNRGGKSPFLLIGDHAGLAIPRRLGRLGLGSEALALHIACDIGIAGLGERLATMLDACFISQSYSRLVIDCNRRLDDPSSILSESDGVAIPGNVGLSAADGAARQADIYQTYQDAIATELDRRTAAGCATVLVSLHSFTPVYQGFARPWRMGVLHRGDSAMSGRFLALLRGELGEAAGDNQPYSMDGTDNTVPLHADPRGLDYLELEVRQDLLSTPEGQDETARFLAALLASTSP